VQRLMGQKRVAGREWPRGAHFALPRRRIFMISRLLMKHTCHIRFRHSSSLGGAPERAGRKRRTRRSRGQSLGGARKGPIRWREIVRRIWRPEAVDGTAICMLARRFCLALQLGAAGKPAGPEQRQLASQQDWASVSLLGRLARLNFSAAGAWGRRDTVGRRGPTQSSGAAGPHLVAFGHWRAASGPPRASFIIQLQ